jgi:ribosome-binding protein aMBF1 (putative translation factor)
MSDFENELNELFKITNTSKISELSKVLNISASTIRSWRTRQKVPAEIYRKLDLLKIKSEKPLENVSKEDLKKHLMEGLFRAVQVKGISLAEDARLIDIAEILIAEIEKSEPNFFIKENKKIG